ncbi:MAG: amidophosphoribosyltransferase [Gammaproteobacteria bacterium]|nr:MAG: amidophosphoribosyltransferase [Gammaproteobacteria bacterium]
MCGIIGIVSDAPVNEPLFEGLTVLQHRGQDAAGIATADSSRLYMRKSNGLVRDVFRARHLTKLMGNMGIGHVRYPTAGSSSLAEAQPLYVNSPYGIALGHNGNLTNTQQLREQLESGELRHLNTDSDSEVLLNVLAGELHKEGQPRISHDELFRAIAATQERCQGAYAVVALITGFGIAGFRDPHGIRPLVIGRRRRSGGYDHIIASESVAIDVLGFELVRDVKPGEAVIIDHNGVLHSRQCVPAEGLFPCLFEYVYFARPDSIIDGICVNQSRLRMGESLAKKILREWPDHDIDVVIPVPDTARTAALELAYHLSVNYREGFIKNRYIARTFIMPGQSERRRSVRRKLNPIAREFKDRNVLVVDDSIVRGTTSEQLVQLARDAGARKVYFASAAPPVRYPNVYGIDMPTPSELVAYGRDADEVAEYLGADRLFYQDLDDLKRAVTDSSGRLDGLDASCFDGQYVTGDVGAEYLREVGALRSEEARDGEESIELGEGDEEIPLG